MAEAKKKKKPDSLAQTKVAADEGDTRARATLAKKGIKRNYTDPDVVDKAILGTVALGAGGGPEVLGGRLLARAAMGARAAKAAKAAEGVKDVTPKALPAAAKAVSPVAKRAAAKAKLTRASKGTLGKGATKEKPVMRAPNNRGASPQTSITEVSKTRTYPTASRKGQMQIEAKKASASAQARKRIEAQADGKKPPRGLTPAQRRLLGAQ